MLKSREENESMKKLVSLILALAMVLCAVSFASADETYRVAMITDSGDITDQSFNQHDTHTFPMYDFNACVRLQEINLRHPYRSLDEMQKTVSAKLSELQARFPRYIDRVEQLGTELERLGLTPDNTYLYIQGHHIMDCVVLKILIPVCTVLRREREQEIKRLAEHNEQFRNELTGYENSQVNVSVMLKKNSGYKNLYLYQWLKEDIMEFLEREEQSRR